jgi:predicted lipid-binding transport protein (Tim44 family)
MRTPSKRGARAAASYLVVVLTAALAMPAHAYIGPGAGLTAIGAVLALLAALFLAVVGFVWYPVKRLLRGRQAESPAAAAAGPLEAQDQPHET